MFRQIRYQTGEMDEIVLEMEKGNIPCMDVDDQEELEWFLLQLEKRSIFRVDGLSFDREARDRVKEPEFEFRIALFEKTDDSVKKDNLYIDFYFEPDIEKTYDPIMGD